jgi:hypothetical protein
MSFLSGMFCDMRVDLSTKLQLLTLHCYRRRQSGCQGGWIDPFVRIDRTMRAHKSISRANPTISWSRRSTHKQPSKYIRFIYNRVILESATVRAAAVSALYMRLDFNHSCQPKRFKLNLQKFE